MIALDPVMKMPDQKFPVMRAEESLGALHDRVEDRPYVSLRAADHLQDVAGCCPLIECIVQGASEEFVLVL